MGRKSGQNMKKEKSDDRRSYSFRGRIYLVMYILMGLEAVILTVYIIYSSWSIRQQSFADIHRTLEMYDSSVSETLRSVNFYLVDISHDSAEFTQVAVQTDIYNSYTEIARVQNLLEYNLRPVPIVEGMFAYFPLSDTWVSVQNYSDSRQIFHDFLRESMKQETFRKAYSTGVGLEWRVLEHDETTYLLRIIDNKNSFCGIWTNLDKLDASLTLLNDIKASAFFTDEDGRIFPMWADSVLDSADDKERAKLSTVLKQMDQKEDYGIVRIGGIRYLTVEEPLSITGDTAFTAVLIPMRETGLSARNYIQITFVILGITLIAFIIVSRLLRRFLRRTVTILGNVTDEMVAGKEYKRIDMDRIHAREIRQIGTSFNTMVDRVQNLRIQAYEENIQAKNYQLLALRSQAAPHFLINCLNMIGYMADGTEENTKIIHQMVATLSQHLRYTLSTSERVPLSREAAYEENYVELAKIRFPGYVDFEMDISEEAQQAMVFPLILIMFTENTFKYNLVVGEVLKLVVRAYVRETEDGKRLHIVQIDSGGGYPDDILNGKTSINAAELEGDGGAHIGIRNISGRLRLYYGDSAVLMLSNEPGMGARNDIDIPFVEYREDE